MKRTIDDHTWNNLYEILTTLESLTTLTMYDLEEQFGNVREDESENAAIERLSTANRIEVETLQLFRQIMLDC